MASGVFHSGVLYGLTPGLSGNVPGEHELPQGPRGARDTAAGRIQGPLTSARPIAIRSLDQTGAKAATFLNDWYNRIHILPRSIDFGAVTGGAIRSAVLWNAYLSPSTLEDVTESGAEALNLAGPASSGTVLRALEYVSFSISPDEAGPATIDAEYGFSFDGRPDVITLAVIGRRARLWPFAPNWRGSVDMGLEYKTDIVTSRSGREQRRALRKSPRRRFSYTVTLGQTDERVLHRMMTQWQARPWLLSDPVRAVTCIDGTPIGSTQVRVDRVPAWLRAGQAIILGADTVTAVTAVDDDVVTLDSPLTAVLRAGTSMRPGLSGLLSTTLRARHPSSATAEFALDFSVDAGSEIEDADGPSMWILGGREVFIHRPNWADPVESEFTWPNEQIDFGYGRVKTFVPQTFGTMVRRASFVSQGAEAVGEIEQFFSRQRGQAGEFMAPTWLNDLPPKFDLVEGTNFIRVEGFEVAAGYADDPTYKAVAVIMRDGRRIFREVTSITAVSDVDGDDSVLYLDGSWASDLPRDEVVMICWMPVMRMGADQITVEWLTDSVAQTSLALRTLEALPAEDPVPPYDDAAAWLLEVWGGPGLFDPLQRLINVEYPEAIS